MDKCKCANESKEPRRQRLGRTAMGVPRTFIQRRTRPLVRRIRDDVTAKGGDFCDQVLNSAGAVAPGAFNRESSPRPPVLCYVGPKKYPGEPQKGFDVREFTVLRDRVWILSKNATV